MHIYKWVGRACEACIFTSGWVEHVKRAYLQVGGSSMSSMHRGWVEWVGRACEVCIFTSGWVEHVKRAL